MIINIYFITKCHNFRKYISVIFFIDCSRESNSSGATMTVSGSLIDLSQK